jgi:hypothetical protein
MSPSRTRPRSTRQAGFGQRRRRATTIIYLLLILTAGGMFAMTILEWIGLFRLRGTGGAILLFGVGPLAALVLYLALHRLSPQRFPLG